VYVVTAAEMREMDRITIEDAGISGLVLMENAGRSVAKAVAELHEQTSGGHVCILCGKGNNGGDGFVAARYLSQWGIEVGCILVASRDQVTGDALTQLDTVDTLGIEVVEAAEGLDAVEGAVDLIETAAVCVDALLGTGLQSDVRAPVASVIEQLNQSPCRVVAVDVPSGVCSDTGQVLGNAVRADMTVTFALYKRGLLVYPGAELAGEIIVTDIGIPNDVIDHIRPNTYLIDLETPIFAARPPDSHKGHYGHVLIVGGSAGKGGATLLAGLAALRCGSGLVTVLTDSHCQASLEGCVPELMIETGWTPTHVEPDKIRAAMDGKTAVVVGPGLDPDDIGLSVLTEILRDGSIPTVIDATGLALLAKNPGLLGEGSPPLILTPHPGEAGQLLASSSTDVQNNRFEAIASLTGQYNAHIILKGAHTLVGGLDHSIHINTTGNPGMASAGTGDVLAGMVGSFVGRGIPLLEAAITATHLHGLAGDFAAQELGEESVIASDIIDVLPSLLDDDDDDVDDD
jgi:NAD(P)H-hydrate epimerase